MRPELFTIARSGRGRLSTMARPRSGDWLEDEMRGLAGSGVGIVVSLLCDAEVLELDLASEESLARAAGIEFLRLPTADREVPSVGETIRLACHLCQRLRQDRHVAIHCRNGIGRASTLAAAVLVIEGVASADAWQKIARARGLSVPDTDAQRAFVDTLPVRDWWQRRGMKPTL